MSLKSQNDCLRRMIAELSAVNIPVTGVYMPSEETDGGLELDGLYVLQIAPYHEPQFILDKANAPGEEVATFTGIGELITYMMEN